MTMSNPTPSPETEELPPPMLRRMISNPFFPETGAAPIVWQIDTEHPLKSNARVIKMFVVDDGVEVYAMESLPQGMFRGMRNLIPMHWVRLTEEIMHPDVLNEEIEAAEARATGDDVEDDDFDDSPDGGAETVPPPAPSPPNGQEAS